MPTPTKSIDAMDKHLTAAERNARLVAEESVQPLRQTVSLKKPTWLTGKGAKYWESILERMAGTAILDDLDTETLAIYCAQLYERDLLQADLKTARKMQSDKKKEDHEDLSNLDAILSLTKQLNAKDEKIMKFASELGCTPSGRVRLAQKRAVAAAETDGNGDLFGD